MSLIETFTILMQLDAKQASADLNNVEKQATQVSASLSGIYPREPADISYAMPASGQFHTPPTQNADKPKPQVEGRNGKASQQNITDFISPLQQIRNDIKNITQIFYDQNVQNPQQKTNASSPQNNKATPQNAHTLRKVFIEGLKPIVAIFAQKAPSDGALSNVQKPILQTNAKDEKAAPQPMLNNAMPLDANAAHSPKATPLSSSDIALSQVSNSISNNTIHETAQDKTTETSNNNKEFLKTTWHDIQTIVENVSSLIQKNAPIINAATPQANIGQFGTTAKNQSFIDEKQRFEAETNTKIAQQQLQTINTTVVPANAADTARAQNAENSQQTNVNIGAPQITINTTETAQAVKNSVGKIGQMGLQGAVNRAQSNNDDGVTG